MGMLLSGVELHEATYQSSLWDARLASLLTWPAFLFLVAVGVCVLLREVKCKKQGRWKGKGAFILIYSSLH